MGLLATLTAIFFPASADAQRQPTLTGDIRLHKKFHSKILNNDRDLIVYLPPGYEASKTQPYPVLYMHDGQNIFDGVTSYLPGQEWRVDETAEALIAAGKIEPLIIVGIYNAGKDRGDEYTPAKDKTYNMGGKADLYGRMLVEEIKPFIDGTYRTLRSAQHTGLGGSSLGGIASLYLGLKHQDVFSRLAVVSPTVWFAERHIVHYVEALPRKPETRIWLDMGTKEGRNPDEEGRSINEARGLQKILVKKGWKLGEDLKYFEAKGAEHNEGAWAERVESILTFLFPREM